ncbi:MAG: type II secretion system protein [Denitromonas halophila]|uniref:Type II secretion system protein n=3 Tax=Denitromonas TaxID=139331 RepID=A0A557S4G7_9RHOO|nr:type II secretion system protein [Denitromonas ohlonensis]TVO72308.1 type II secretion system protein [Denitromonas ohlonensis]TVT77725.1 MAG: type II secretion system protein [Denitromonas halophila]
MRAMSPIPSRRQAGFTLAELAIVLLILTVLAAALVVPFSARLAAERRDQTATMLDNIHAALIGYAIVHGRLPCPSTRKNPLDARYGEEEFDAATNNCVVTTEGMLPWRTLGLPAFDAWGLPRQAESDPWTGHFRYRVDLGFSSAQAGARIRANTAYQDEIKVIDHNGNEITVSSYTGSEVLKNTTAIALVYATGPNLTPNGANASYESGSDATYEAGDPSTTFDDMVMWIGRPLLIARMAQAGAL